MAAQAMTMDAAIDGPRARDAAPASRRAIGWRGEESLFVLAAAAAAPWPLWSALAWLGLPGSAHAPALAQGVLPLAIVLAAMGLFAHRPRGRAAARWALTVIGTGLIGELFANAVTDLGRGPGLGVATDVTRALAVWLVAVLVYEVAPIVAASSRLARAERRALALDLAAHALFLGLAAAAFARAPTWGTAWFVSPWIAVVVALPLAAARSGPERDAALPAPHPRGGLLLGLAALAWAAVGLVAIGGASAIRGSLHEMRWGLDPLDGVLLALPLVSLALSLAAALVLWVQARIAAKSTAGTIADVGDRSVLVEGASDVQLAVAVDRGPLPSRGASVTLIGARVEPPGGGPFRDGAVQLRASRTWLGPPAALARALRQRAAGWLLYGAIAALGVLLRVL